MSKQVIIVEKSKIFKIIINNWRRQNIVVKTKDTYYIDKFLFAAFNDYEKNKNNKIITEPFNVYIKTLYFECF